MLEQRLEVAVNYVLGVLRGARACGENEPRVLVIRRPELLMALIVSVDVLHRCQRRIWSGEKLK